MLPHGQALAMLPLSLELQPRAAEAVARARGRATGGNLEALPLFHEDQRVALRDRARSVLQDRLVSWLRSEEAAEWRRSRCGIFGTGIADPDTLALGDAGLGDGSSGAWPLEGAAAAGSGAAAAGASAGVGR